MKHIQEKIEKEIDKILLEANLKTKSELTWIEKNIFGLNPKHSDKERELYIAFAMAGFFIGEKYACDKILENYRNIKEE